MTIQEHIEQDLKTAMLAGEKTLVTTLRGIKSAILYAEVAEGKRDSGLSQEAIMSLLQKEAKKRQESAVLYRQGGNEEKAIAEDLERAVIQKYLPKQLSEDELRVMVIEQAKTLDISSMQQMGQLISAVKKACKGSGDGSLIARLVKEYLSE